MWRHEAAAKEKIHMLTTKIHLKEKDLAAHTSLFFEGSSEAAQLRGKEMFRVDTFIPIIDTLNTQLKKCSAAYQEIDSRFSCLCQLTTIESDELTKNAKNLQNFIMKTLM